MQSRLFPKIGQISSRLCWLASRGNHSLGTGRGEALGLKAVLEAADRAHLLPTTHPHSSRARLPSASEGEKQKAIRQLTCSAGCLSGILNL